MPSSWKGRLYFWFNSMAGFFFFPLRFCTLTLPELFSLVNTVQYSQTEYLQVFWSGQESYMSPDTWQAVRVLDVLISHVLNCWQQQMSSLRILAWFAVAKKKKKRKHSPSKFYLAKKKAWGWAIRFCLTRADVSVRKRLKVTDQIWKPLQNSRKYIFEQVRRQLARGPIDLRWPLLFRRDLLQGQALGMLQQV